MSKIGGICIGGILQRVGINCLLQVVMKHKDTSVAKDTNLDHFLILMWENSEVIPVGV